MGTNNIVITCNILTIVCLAIQIVAGIKLPYSILRQRIVYICLSITEVGLFVTFIVTYNLLVTIIVVIITNIIGITLGEAINYILDNF